MSPEAVTGVRAQMEGGGRGVNERKWEQSCLSGS